MNDDMYPDAKVLFRHRNGDGSIGGEMLWATSLGADQYRLESFPYFVRGISWGDVVLAPFVAHDGAPAFQRVLLKSGHGTISVFFELPIIDGNRSDQILAHLVRLGCHYRYDGMKRRHAAISIPPGMAVNAVCGYLLREGVAWVPADLGNRHLSLGDSGPVV
ncbi:DUF4265 domain-containing protein [Pseudoduganella violacea]|uniref:DUF4265 domain-containing protein n=1 Tax=Pseudoduganella violacea TaxID=1715466 RepID=A0A7W5FWC5_9BURK|nr:DUF4265 domain-containing protein [Pseudoduganella violacea]MBB3121714.1 hypothetical protein [Pseudoduganella violacea]